MSSMELSSVSIDGDELAEYGLSEYAFVVSENKGTQTRQVDVYEKDSDHYCTFSLNHRNQVVSIETDYSTVFEVDAMGLLCILTHSSLLNIQ